MIRCAGLPVLSMDLHLLRSGVWTAELSVDADENITGAVSIGDEDGNTFAATVVASGEHFGRVQLAVDGGAAGMGTTLGPKHYVGARARLVASELVADAGELLDVNSDTLLTTLDAWTRPAVTAGVALTELVDRLGLEWRVLPNGKVWIGAPGFEELVLEDALELRRDYGLGLVELAVDSLGLVPGVTYQGERVTRVDYQVREKSGIRAFYWVQ